MKPSSLIISVVVPVYKDPDGIQDTLHSLSNQTLPRNLYEIIVVNDGGDPDTRKAAQMFGAVVVHDVKPRAGSYNARNAGLRLANAKFIAFVDADISVPMEWAETGAALLNTYDYVGGAVKIDETKLRSLADYYEYLTAFDNEMNLKKKHYIPTANLFVQAAVFEKLGGFDERLQSGGDVEFGNRVFESGEFSMSYSENLYVFHPPRGYRSLVEKYIRVKMGTTKLAELYPERFLFYRISAKNVLVSLLDPVHKVLITKRKIRFSIKYKVIFWSILYGLVNAVNLSKIKWSQTKT